MNSQPALIGTTLMVVVGLGLASVMAAEPTTRISQRSDICSQVGSGYVQLYTIEEETKSITICQKDQKYYYVTQAK